MAVYTVLSFTNWIIDIIGELGLDDLIANAPDACLAVACMVLFSMILAVVASLTVAIAKNAGNWKKRGNEELYYSFAHGSGIYQSKRIFREARSKVWNYKWWFFSFAGMAHLLGGISCGSKFLAFLLSFLYIPISAMGFLEMLLRFTVGTLILCVISLLYKVVLLLLWIINLIMMPFAVLADKKRRQIQHCSNCYREFDLPVIECPNCGTRHKNLTPGTTGLLWARCSCGKFMSCNALTGRAKMNAACPKCGEELAAASYNPLTIQVIGGNKSGKTAYISAFQHVYLNSLSVDKQRKTKLFRDDDFDDLENQFQNGIPEPSSESIVNSYSIVHTTGRLNYDGVSIYDIPDEAINSASFERNPLNLGYMDGIVLIIDPLSVDTERCNSKLADGVDSVEGYSDDDIEGLIVSFINIYSDITSRKTMRKTRTPIAVLISKADLSVIDEKIGEDAIRKKQKSHASIGKISPKVRNEVCKDYLLSIGLANAVRNIESVFSNVAYFPVSAVGHMPKQGVSYEPRGVIEPIQWIALKSGKMTGNLRNGLRG